VRLKAEADNSGWQADGMDLQHVQIVAVDKIGRKVQTAVGEVTFSVDGPADIVGVINGDINSNEMTTGYKRSLYHGTCTVILRSKQGDQGKVTLTATAPGMKSVRVVLPIRGDKVRP
jgi:beta-galactosidase